MIPKKIHYCWFGGNSLPKEALKCIDSWKKFFPDYEIIEWNESNYDVNKIPYIAQAYIEKKYAFVSDYARYDVLYNEGGMYFDTDVEVIKSFEDILSNGAFLGCETDGKYCPNEGEKGAIINKSNYSSFCIRINPGLGMGMESNMKFCKEFLDMYKGVDFIKADGKYNSVAVVRNTTNLLVKHGIKDIKGIQKIDEITIYPSDYFNPLDSQTELIHRTENTHSIHWYSLSWMDKRKKARIKLINRIRRIGTLLKKIYGD